MVRCIALLKIKPIGQPEQKNWSSSLCLGTISPLFSLYDLFELFSLLAQRCWTRFHWSQWVFFSDCSRPRLGWVLLLVGPDTACAYCDIRSKPHYSPANPELPCWLQGLSWIKQNNQQQDAPQSSVTSGSNVNSSSCLAGWGLFALSAAPQPAPLWFYSSPRQPKADLMYKWLLGEICKCVIFLFNLC